MSLRYFNAAGCDPDGETGEWHEPETHLIPRALMAAMGQIPALEIFGDDYPYAGRNVYSGLCSCDGFGGCACAGAFSSSTKKYIPLS